MHAKIQCFTVVISCKLTRQMHRWVNVLIVLISVFSPSRHHLSLWNIISKCFSLYFCSLKPFNEMFSVNGKSHFCVNTFTQILFTLLLAVYLTNRPNYFQILRISIVSAILSEIFIQIYFFEEIFQETEDDVFSEHTVHNTISRKTLLHILLHWSTQHWPGSQQKNQLRSHTFATTKTSKMLAVQPVLKHSTVFDKLKKRKQHNLRVKINKNL